MIPGSSGVCFFFFDLRVRGTSILSRGRGTPYLYFFRISPSSVEGGMQAYDYTPVLRWSFLGSCCAVSLLQQTLMGIIYVHPLPKFSGYPTWRTQFVYWIPRSWWLICLGNENCADLNYQNFASTQISLKEKSNFA